MGSIELSGSQLCRGEAPGELQGHKHDAEVVTLSNGVSYLVFTTFVGKCNGLTLGGRNEELK